MPSRPYFLSTQPCTVCRNLSKFNPGGANSCLKCFLSEFHAFTPLKTLKIDFPVFRAISSMSCSSAGKSRNRVAGTATFVFSSTNMYVPIEQCGWHVKVTVSSPLSADSNLENGTTAESGNQS